MEGLLEPEGSCQVVEEVPYPIGVDGPTVKVIELVSSEEFLYALRVLGPVELLQVGRVLLVPDAVLFFQHPKKPIIYSISFESFRPSLLQILFAWQPRVELI